jgi:hypothetical protein
MEEIGEGAFGGCASLVRIVIPSVIKAIKRAFYGCLQLTSVTLNNWLKEIGKQAFYKCRSLMPITLSPAVRSIDETAFWDCRQFMTV